MTRVRQPRRLRSAGWLWACVLALLTAASTLQAAPPPVDPFSDANQADPFSDANAVKEPSAEPTRAAPGAAKAVSPRGLKEPPTAKRITLEVSASPAEVRRGETVKLTITGTPKPGYHTYPLTKRAANPNQDAEGLSKLTYDETSGLQPLWPVQETEPVFKDEGTLGYFLEHEGKFTWSQDLLVPQDAPPGTKSLRFRVWLQVCDKSCVFGEHLFEVPITVTAEPPVPLTPALEERLAAKAPGIIVVPVPSTAGGSGWSRTAPVDSGLLAFILSGVFWGAVSLVTPCVFPMIPITVSYFLKQSEKQHHRPLTMAAVYCTTIVVVLTVAAVALVSVFRALSTTSGMNFVLGGLFLFFALSLFGMYEIELPSGLARFTSAREGKGGLVGTMFMALTFTILSFACVAPFLGGFGGTADTARLTWAHRVLGGLAFSLTFASPFFVLALFPNLLKRLPKSGNWLNSVKVVMGFLEVAAALKFLRAGELLMLPKPVVFSYDLVLGLYVALSILCGLYLLNVYRLPHDTPAEHLSVPRLLFSLLFLGLGLYLMPALNKPDPAGANQRPGGAAFAWIDSFLLPEETKSELPWTADLKAGINDALRQPGKLVFIDFTGVTCTNCSINEQNVFTRREVKDLLRHYSLVKLYTDKVPIEFYPPEEQASFGGSTSRQRSDAAANLDFQRKSFDTEQLPLYVILEPLPNGDFKEVARYAEGKINDEAAFMRFLSQPLNAGSPGARTLAKGG